MPVPEARPVVMYMRDGRRVTGFPSLLSASEALGVSRNAIHLALKRGGLCCGYQWRYGDDAPRRLPEYSLPCRRTPVARCRLDGTVEAVYPSVRAAAEELHIQPYTVYTYIYSGRTRGGCILRYARTDEEDGIET